MKFKSIIACGLLLLGVGAATTSCEDMFTPENNLVTTDLAPKDSLYQVMGIIQRMQKLADRTVLLGEIRADLVEVDPIHASADIQELAANNISATNVYNQPADYYAVINNCNIYLANVDSIRKSQGNLAYFEKEICAVKSFRAWCYLELVKIYGEVPFVTEPVLTSDAAEAIVSSGAKANMATILDFCIQDLQKYPYMDKNEELRQAYGNKAYAGLKLSQMMIPVRALLAELYLWRGSYTNSQDDYVNAIRMYHDYFTFPKEEIYTDEYSTQWYDRDFQTRSTSLLNNFGSGAKDVAGVLPLDTTAYFGNYTELRAVFNSQYSNNYYPAVLPSQRMKDISKAQDYCMYVYEFGRGDTIYAPHDANSFTDAIQEGDLRLSTTFFTRSNFSESQYNSNVNPLAYANIKMNNGSSSSVGSDKRLSQIPYFRNTILYLHLAEALNRAGFPETAYAILAHGLSYYTMNDRSIISQDEFDRLCEIKSYGFTLQEAKYQGDMLAKTSASFVIWPSEVFGTLDKATAGNGTTTLLGGSGVQIGIHSRGCGDTEFNTKYYLDNEKTLAGLLPLENAIAPLPPLYDKTDTDSVVYKEAYAEYEAEMVKYNASVEKDSISKVENVKYLASPEVRAVRQARVAELILEEEALEGAFEGLRFYDIMRYQMQEMGGAAIGSTITMPSYIETKYGKSSMEGKPWYLTLPRR